MLYHRLAPWVVVPLIVLLVADRSHFLRLVLLLLPDNVSHRLKAAWLVGKNQQWALQIAGRLNILIKQYL